MATGTVKWFNNAKGYGFVLPEAGGDDLFIHYSSIQMDGYKSLKAGQGVQYELQEGPKGLHAVNIRPSDAEAGSAAEAEGQTGATVGATACETSGEALTAQPVVEISTRVRDQSTGTDGLGSVRPVDERRVALEEH